MGVMDSAVVPAAILSGLIVGFAVVLPGAAAPLSETAGQQAPTAAYEAACKGCHGPGALGELGPRLAGTPLTIEQFTKTVRGGRGSMPPMAVDTVSDQDIASIYKWLSSTRPAPRSAPPEPPAGAGERTPAPASYESACQGCHGEGAAGGLAPRLAGTSLTVEQFGKTVRGGRGNMPPMAVETVSDRDIAAIYKWLSSAPRPARPQSHVAPGAHSAAATAPTTHPRAAATFAAGAAAAATAHGGDLSGTPYPAQCAACHGPAGAGALGPPLAGLRLSLGGFLAVVRSGRRAMPAFGASQIPDDDIAILFHALQAGTPKPRGPASAAAPASAAGPAANKTPSPAAPGPAQKVSSQAFVASCASCHGPTGMGGIGPPLAHKGFTGDEFRGIVRRGKGTMPSFTETALPDDTLDTIAEYLGVSTGTGAGPGTVGRASSLASLGGRTYKADCARCHGPTGMGSSGPRLASSTVSLDDIEVVRKGRKAMPSFAQSSLTDMDLAAVYFYLEHSRSLASQTQGGPSVGTAAQAPTTAAITPAFATWCASCHGPEAAGSFGPPLVGTRLPLPTFVNIVRTGKRRMPAVPMASVSDSDLAAMYNSLERASPAEAGIPVSYRISGFLTSRRITTGLLLFVLVSILLALRVAMQWVRRADLGRLQRAAARIGYRRALAVGLCGLVADGFLASWLYRSKKGAWLLHELLLYGVPALALGAVILGGHDTARPDPSWLSPRMIVPAVMAFAVLVAAMVVRKQYGAQRDFEHDAQFGLDYLFLDLLILAIAAGFAADGARHLGDVAWVQPTRLVHLALVVVLLLSAPWTSFAHAFVVPVLSGVGRILEEAEHGGDAKPGDVTAAAMAPVALSGTVLDGLEPGLRHRILNCVGARVSARANR